MTAHYHLNEDQTVITVSASWDISVIKTDGPLTDAQLTALKSYCTRFVSEYIKEKNLNVPIELNASEVFRTKGGYVLDKVYFDADAGTLYEPCDILKTIMDGQHEIRVKATNDQEIA